MVYALSETEQQELFEKKSKYEHYDIYDYLDKYVKKNHLTSLSDADPIIPIKCVYGYLLYSECLSMVNSDDVRQIANDILNDRKGEKNVG